MAHQWLWKGQVWWSKGGDCGKASKVASANVGRWIWRMWFQWKVRGDFSEASKMALVNLRRWLQWLFGRDLVELWSGLPWTFGDGFSERLEVTLVTFRNDIGKLWSALLGYCTFATTVVTVYIRTVVRNMTARFPIPLLSVTISLSILYI